MIQARENGLFIQEIVSIRVFVLKEAQVAAILASATRDID
jgi:hypothetical protein